MESGKKYPAARSLFIPVLPRPSGDRFVATAVYQALHDSITDDFSVASRPVEAFDAQDRLKPLETIEQEIDALVKATSVTHSYKPVLFYTSNQLIDYLKPLNAGKFAMSHLHPERLHEEIFGTAHAWRMNSLRDVFGLDLLAVPAHAALDRPSAVLDDPHVVWMFGVPSHKAPLEADLSDDPFFKNAGAHPIFVLSLPDDDPADNKKLSDLLVRVIHHEEVLGERDIILVDHPRSGAFKTMLLDALEKEYPLVTKMGLFTSHVLPAVSKHPLSKLFLPGNSASMIAESIQALPPHKIVVNGASYRDFEHRQIVPFYFDHGYVHLLSEDGQILKPHAVTDYGLSAAHTAAQAALAKFVHGATLSKDKPIYMPRASS